MSFRGSQDIKNWLINLQTTRTSYPACKDCSVHAGFYSGYLMVQKYVNAEVSDLLAKYPKARIMVTGHSLGGALAILAAMDLHTALSHQEMEIYTFGQPRVGNYEFVKYYQ